MMSARRASRRSGGNLGERVGLGGMEEGEFSSVFPACARVRSLCIALLLGSVLAGLAGCQATDTSESSGERPNLSHLGPPERVDVGKYSRDVPIAGRVWIEPGGALEHSAISWAKSLAAVEEWVRSPVSVPFEIVVHYDGGFIGVFPGGVAAVVYDGSRHPPQFAAGLDRESREYQALIGALRLQLTKE